MSTQIELQPEIIARLAAQAISRGISVDELLGILLTGLETSQREASEFSLADFERDLDALAEGLEHLPEPYQGTYSRADIYADHD